MPVDLDRLASIKFEEKLFRAGSQLYRVYFRAGDYPVKWDHFRKWGPHPECRFDHHEGSVPHDQDREILYVAERPHTALIEVFKPTGVLHLTRDTPALAQFALAEPLTLIDLTNAWIYRAGGSPEEIISGNREVSREWARAIWDLFRDIDGIYYRSAIALSDFNIALFERARQRRCLPDEPISDLLLTHVAIRSIVDATAHDFNLDVL